MASDVIFKAFEIDGLSMPEKLLLLVLCNRADKELKCWRSQATLAKEASMSVKTVGRALDSLETKGLIRRKGSVRKGGTTSTDMIWIAFDGAQKPAEKPSKSISQKVSLISQRVRAEQTESPFQTDRESEHKLPSKQNIETARAREPCEEARPTRLDEAEMRARAKALREATSAALLSARKDPRDQSHRMRVRAQ